MVDKKIKVFGFGQSNSGVTYHRIAMPLGWMDDIEGMVSNVINPEWVGDKFDLVIFNRLNPYQDQIGLIRQGFGCKVVIDIDDHWHLPTNHINYEDYLHHGKLIERNLYESDLVTCTHERLADICRKFNNNVQVLPNALPYGDDQFTINKVEDDSIRFFWAGGCTHLDDLRILKNPIRRLMAHKSKIKMVIGGYDDCNDISKYIWDKMTDAFTANRTLNHQILPSMPVNKYMTMYDHADVMLIPLVANNWSANKSNLKLLEAAAKKVPVICQKVAPYSDDMDAPVLWVEKQEDWYKHMNYFINNKNSIIDYGEKIHEWAVSKYNLRDVNIKRREAYASLCKV